MRVTTELFVSAILRRVFASGGFAAIVNRGATEAGAVFVIERQKAGAARLFAPASQTSYESGRPDDRRFTALLHGPDADIEARLERERRFDPDIWIVEIEPGNVSVDDLIEIMTP